MIRHMVLGLLVSFVLGGATNAQDKTPVGSKLNEAIEKALKDAASKVSPSVVQITTTGGADMVVTGPKGPALRKALGPTTGVIVSEDGYIISSAFNFINNPPNILVHIPGGTEPLVAKRVANDKSRMLTLLKIDAKGLPVPKAVPTKEIVEGQWAIALGRSLETKLGIKKEQPPVFSIGIVSAVNRIWGKAYQVDCKVSPVNYGGPTVDSVGRVQGIIVPASPKGDDETAGFEWYDSGIGFAVPFEDILAVLPRLKGGKDLKKGMLGVRMKSPDIYGPPPEIAEVVKDSAAAKAGLKAGDVLIEVDGIPVERMAKVQHILGRKYEGDKVTLKYRRGTEVLEIKDLELVGTSTVVAAPFLGILPMRDDPKLGVEVRYVFAKSPAEKAGIKEGDCIVKFGVPAAKGKLTPFNGAKAGREQFFDFLNTLAAGTEVELELKRKDGKVDTVKATLDPLPGTGPKDEGAIPDKLPENSTVKKALEPLENTIGVKPPVIDKKEAPKIETGLVKKKTPDGENTYYVYVPDEYDPNISYGVLLWLHPPGKNKEADFEAMVELWADFCAEKNILLVAPVSTSESGWIPSESEYVIASVRDVIAKYTIDRQRVVAHGMAVGGQMAIYLGFNHRDLFHGVAATGAIVNTAKDNVAGQRLSFYLAGGELDPIAKSVGESRDKLVEKKYPTVLRIIMNRGREYLEEAQLREVARWIDSLDRQ